MATPSRQAVSFQPDDSVVRAHLECILSSPAFSRSERLSKFLAFVVEETLAGRAEGLKEQVIGAALYSQDVGSDSVVRVDARRLRDKLREYYAESPDPPVRITLPKGSYVPYFEYSKQEVAAKPQRRWWPIAAVACLLAGVAVIAALYLPRAPVEYAPVPLTSFPGYEDAPSLSPDGNFVAFGWAGPPEPSGRIYVKAVRGDALRALTNGTAENLPSWSPDGQYIAFVRAGGAYVSSALGGAERLISQRVSYVTWSADSKALLIRTPGPNGPHGIVQVTIETLERRQLTQAPIGDGEWRFQVSPDGKTLAFIRYNRSGVADLYLKPLPDGEPRRITNWSSSLAGVAWTPDGREIVYSVDDGSSMRLWRISASVPSPGRGHRLLGIDSDVRSPSISRPAPGKPARLAYVQRQQDVGLRLVDLESQLREGALTGVTSLAESSRGERTRRFTRDSKRVLFASDRDGERATWISNFDGSGLRKLLPGVDGQLSLSPDESTLAFDKVVEGSEDIYLKSLMGGQPKRLTKEQGLNGFPEWSRDGRWIYFTSTRTGKGQIFKMPSGGGEAIQITRNGGFKPRESADGRFLYYVDRLPLGTLGRGNLMRVRVEGGEEKQLLPDIYGHLWDASDSGIIFFASRSVSLYRYADAKVTQLGVLPFRPAGVPVGWTVSRDGRWLMTNVMERNDADLMFVDNFR